jgi:hypothetical protein
MIHMIRERSIRISLITHPKEIGDLILEAAGYIA